MANPLEKRPDNALAPSAQEEVSVPVIAIALSDQSYWQRFRRIVVWETGEYVKKDFAYSAVAAIFIGALTLLWEGGISLTAAYWSAIGFIAVFVARLGQHVINTPKLIDSATRNALNASEGKYAQLTKNKVIFELDEIGTRVFITQDPTVIRARLKLRFHNKEPYDEHVRSMRLSLHHLASGEIGTWIIDDRYYGLDGTEIPREGFEGMLIQGKRLTPWYFCVISIDLMQGENTRIPEDLTGAHCLSVTMAATNQEPYESQIFLNWEKACDKNGTAILSYGAPAIRRWESRRLFEKTAE